MSQSLSTTKELLYRYGIAIAIALMAVLLTAIIWDSVTHDAPFILLVCAVVFSSWLGGFVPGLLCSFISFVMVDYFLIEPRYLILSSPDRILQFLLFVLIAWLISWLQESRNRSERAMRQYKEELELVLNAMNEGVIVQDRAGKVVFANAAFAAARIEQPLMHALIGVPDSKIESAYKLLDDRETTIVHTTKPGNRVFLTKRPAEATFGIKARETGHETWLTVKSAPILDKGKDIRLVINIFHDITELRRVEKLRAQSSERIRKVIDNLSAFVGVLTPDGVVIEMNASALRSANLDLGEVVGKRLDQTYWWSYDDSVQAKLRDSIQQAAQGESIRYDVSVRLASDQYITLDFTLAPVFDREGQLEYLIPSGIDVTSRNNLTNQLIIQQRRQSNIINHVPGVVFEGTVSDNGVITTDFFSPYIEKMLGYTLAEVRNDPLFWKKVILAEDWDNTVKQVNEIHEGGKPRSTQYRCYAKDGHIVFVESHFGFLRDEQNVLLGTVGVMMDVTDRRQAEDELAHYAQELRRSNEELEQFAYVASHDLQEPLRMVTSYLQLIEQRYETLLDADAKEFIRYAVDGSTRMKSLINDLLVYSRIQRNRAEYEPIEMEDVLHQALRNLQLVIEDSKAIITHDPLPEVKANRVQMLQLMQNLIDNGLKFRLERTPEIHIGVKLEPPLWHFCVKDNGIGIEEEYLERIFIIFQRLHARNEYPGTGIGLAICKKIVDKHGGQIYAQSTLGQGTEFHFTIPVQHDGRRSSNGSHPDTTG